MQHPTWVINSLDTMIMSHDFIHQLYHHSESFTDYMVRGACDDYIAHDIDYYDIS
jgi:hypothetical protein